MDHTLSAKTAKFTSLENLYKYGILFIIFLKTTRAMISIITHYNLLSYNATSLLIFSLFLFRISTSKEDVGKYGTRYTYYMYT